MPATSDVPVAPETTVAPPKPKNWAELFRKNSVPATTAPTANGSTGEKVTDVANKSSGANGAKFDGIADVLHKYKPTYVSPLIQPRGLVNNGNMCFMNAVCEL